MKDPDATPPDEADQANGAGRTEESVDPAAPVAIEQPVEPGDPNGQTV